MTKSASVVLAAALALLSGCRAERAGCRIEVEFAPEREAEVVEAIVPELEGAGLRLWRFEVEPGAGRSRLCVAVERDAQATLAELVSAIERSKGDAVRVSTALTGRFGGLREERELILLAPPGSGENAAGLVRSRAEAVGATGLEVAVTGDTIRIELPTVMRFSEGLGLARAPEFGLYECARGGPARTILREAAQGQDSLGLGPDLERLGDLALEADGEPVVDEAELPALARALETGTRLSEDWRLAPALRQAGGGQGRVEVRVVRNEPALGAGAFERVGAVPYAGPDSTLAGDWHLALAIRPAVVPAFTALTRGIVGSRLAVVLDGLVLAAPMVAAPVRDSLLVIAVPGLDEAGATALARAMALAAGRPTVPVAAGSFSYREFRAD